MNFLSKILDARARSRETSGSKKHYDIAEKERRYELRIDVPGAKLSDIVIALMEGGRTLAVEVNNYRGHETTGRTLIKEFILDERVVHIQKILAVLDNDQLRISVPRKSKDELSAIFTIPVYTPDSLRQMLLQKKSSLESTHKTVRLHSESSSIHGGKKKVSQVLKDPESSVGLVSDSSILITGPIKKEQDSSAGQVGSAPSKKDKMDNPICVTKEKSMAQLDQIEISPETSTTLDTKTPSVLLEPDERTPEHDTLPCAKVSGETKVSSDHGMNGGQPFTNQVEFRSIVEQLVNTNIHEETTRGVEPEPDSKQDGSTTACFKDETTSLREGAVENNSSSKNDSLEKKSRGLERKPSIEADEMMCTNEPKALVNLERDLSSAENCKEAPMANLSE